MARVGGSSVTFGPWASEHIERLVTWNLVGLGLVAIGTRQAIQAESISSVLGWLNLAVVGLVISGAGNGSWLLRGRQSVTVQRHELLPGAVDALRARSRSSASSDDLGDDTAPSGLVAAADAAHYHHAWCIFVSRRDVVSVDRAAHEVAGRRPCGVCEP